MNCKESIESIKKAFPTFLRKSLALVCLTKDNDGKTVIAGMNVTIPSRKDDPEYHVGILYELNLRIALLKNYFLIKPLGEKWKIVYGIVDYVTKESDPHNKLGVDEFLSAMGLFVLPDYRGEGLGLELLKAR